MNNVKVLMNGVAQNYGIDRHIAYDRNKWQQIVLVVKDPDDQ